MAKKKAQFSKVRGKNPKNVPGFQFVRTLSGISEYLLKSNGLRVLLVPDTTTPVVGVMVTYHVGSRNEAVGYTGATHFLEHLLFKGSDNFNEQKGNKLEIVLGEKGALLNATTWYDRTNYYEVLPSEHLEIALAAEADRMRNAWLTDEYRNTEITIVRNEFERNENDPIEPIFKQMWALAYQAHPYHHDTIGWRADIENVPTERLKWFYDQFYWPNNATVTLVGDFQPEIALSFVKKHFGVHGKAPHSFPEIYTTEAVQEGERRAVVERRSSSNVVGVGYKIPSGLDADTPAITLMNYLLTDGKTSRLYRALIDAKLALSVQALNFVLRDPSLTMVFATLPQKVAHEKVERLIKKEFERLAKEGPTKRELARVKKRAQASLHARRDGAYALLSNVNEFLAVGDWTLFVRADELLANVTEKDIKRVATQYAKREACTVTWFVGTLGKKAL